MNIMKNSKGITLIALVITIIVLLILAVVSIAALTREGGLIIQAKNAEEKTKDAEVNERIALVKQFCILSKYSDNMTIEENLETEFGADNVILDETGEYKVKVYEKEYSTGIFGTNKVSNNIPGSSEQVKAFSKNKNVVIEDEYGNKIKIPAGFGLAKESGENVTEGIVIEEAGIEDGGDQFVWIPVTDGDEDYIYGANNVKEKVKLSRYTFNNSTGEANVLAENDIEDMCEEKTETSYGNTAAEDLNEFINKTKLAGGYYIARYEASKGTGNIARSKKEVLPWRNITQPVAAVEARNMDGKENGGNTYYTTDLINSLAWDTALVFIQKFGGEEFSNYSTKKNLGGSQDTKTGSLKDEALKINDMAGNRSEWSTETSNHKINGSPYPCVSRGGNYFNGDYSSAVRIIKSASGADGYIFSFRSILYL